MISSVLRQVNNLWGH